MNDYHGVDWVFLAVGLAATLGGMALVAYYIWRGK